jgi:hypothetical protein
VLDDHVVRRCSWWSRTSAAAVIAPMRQGQRLTRRSALKVVLSSEVSRSAGAGVVLRWFCEGTGLTQLARDNAIGRSTAYRYLHEGIDVLAAAAPGLRGALLAARAAGHPHVTVDGTLIRTDRCHIPGPTARTDRSGRQVDLWWSGKHAAHGGNECWPPAATTRWPPWTGGSVGSVR